MKTEFDVIIVGAGIVGLTTALACAHSGAHVAILDRQNLSAGVDSRVSALSNTSLRLFRNLGLEIEAATQPINDMLVTEGTPDSPWRLHFAGGREKDGKGSLGGIIENPRLKAALIAKIQKTQAIQIVAPIEIKTFETDIGSARVDIGSAALTAPLLIAADGRESRIRKQIGITVQRFDYDAASLVTLISHENSHEGLAWQRLIKGGAIAVLPLKEQRSQIVWSGPEAAVSALEDLSETDFLAILSEKMDSYLGKMDCTTSRRSYPLRLQIADQFSTNRIALVGDAAHVIHPLAGQGLNLGLRDAAALASGIKSAVETGQDIGIAGLLDYDLWRQTDIRAFGALTHALSESSKYEAIGHFRRLGLTLTGLLPGLKTRLTQQAAGESRDLPELMR